MNETTEHAYRAKHIKKAALDIENNSTNFSWQLKHLVKILPSLRIKNFRRGVSGIIKGFLVDYGKANRAKFEKEINVELPIDKEIPFDKNELANYMSFVAFWISGINFIKKEFGKKAETDIVEFLSDMAKFYPEAAVVFNSAQTSFIRQKPSSLKFKLLHLVDSSKNASPSLHVEVAAHTYSRLTDTINKHAGEFSTHYDPIKKALFNRAVKIIEAVLLVKQHVITDVALGLAALSAQDQTFTNERALSLINAMLTEHEHQIPKEVATRIKVVITEIYNEIMKKVNKEPNKKTSQILIEYLQEFEAKKPTV